MEDLSSQQISQVFYLMEILKIEDPNEIRNILEDNNWDVEIALDAFDAWTLSDNHEERKDSRHFYDNQRMDLMNQVQQQNHEYRKAEESQKKKISEQQNKKKESLIKEENYESDKNLFKNYRVRRPIEIKFRLPLKVVQKTFDIKDPIEILFKYVNGCLRDGFENRHSQFDILQSPNMRLKNLMNTSIQSYFGNESGFIGYVLIVKELTNQ